jgi:hypothetical protein
MAPASATAPPMRISSCVACPRLTPVRVSMTEAATATAMPPSPTRTVRTTPEAAPALSGGTAAWVATEA